MKDLHEDEFEAKEFVSLDFEESKFPQTIRSTGCGCCSEEYRIDKGTYIQLLRALIEAIKEEITKVERDEKNETDKT